MTFTLIGFLVLSLKKNLWGSFHSEKLVRFCLILQKSSFSTQCVAASHHEALGIVESRKFRHVRTISMKVRQKLLQIGIPKTCLLLGSNRKVCQACVQKLEEASEEGHSSVEGSQSAVEESHSSLEESQSAVEEGHSSVEEGHSVVEEAFQTYEEECDVDLGHFSGQGRRQTRSCITTQTDDCIILRHSNLEYDVAAMDWLCKARLAFALGRSESKGIQQQAMAWMGQRSLENLLAMTAEDSLKKSNPVIFNFCLGIQGHCSKEFLNAPPFPIQTPSDIYKFVKTTESIMSLTKPVCVLPFHFREVILLYSITRSRLALSLMSCGSSSGSYQAVKGWLSGMAEKNVAESVLPKGK